MATTPRSLRVESCEDRVVPSTVMILSPGHSSAVVSDVYAVGDRGESAARIMPTSHDDIRGNAFGLRGRDTVAPEVRQMDMLLYAPSSHSYYSLHVVSTGSTMEISVTMFWNTQGSGYKSQSQVSSSRNQQSSSDFDSNSSSDSMTRSVVHRPSSSAADSFPDRAGAATAASVPVSVAVPTTAAESAAAAGGAEAAAQQVAGNSPPVAVESRPEFGHLALPILGDAELADASAADMPAVPQSDEPPVAPDEPPALLPESITPDRILPTTVAGDPLPGLLQFNLAAIESGVRGIIQGVTELEHALPDAPANSEDYLWLAAAALVAGGAAQTAWARRPRPSDPRTLGLDSVLARWGEKYVG